MVLVDKHGGGEAVRDLDVLFREARRRRRRRRLATLGVVTVAALAAWAVIDGASGGPRRPDRSASHADRPASTRPANAKRSPTAPAAQDGNFIPGVPAFNTSEDGTVSLEESVAGGVPRFWAERTTDGGLTWTAGPASTHGDRGQVSANRTFVTALDGWAWGGDDYDFIGALYATTDGGRTWHVDLPGWSAQSVEVAPGGSTWIVATHASSAHASCLAHNNCAERVFEAPGPAQVPTPVPVQPVLGGFEELVHPTDSQAEILRQDATALEVTTDSGRHWSRRALPRLTPYLDHMPTQIVQVGADGPNALWAAGWRSLGSSDGSEGQIIIFVSTDAGRTWQRRTPPDPGLANNPGDANGNPYNGAPLLQVASPDVAWYVALDSEDGASVWRTSDKGRRWTRVLSQPGQAVLPVALVVISATTAVLSVIAATGPQIARTTNGGLTWHYANLPAPRDASTISSRSDYQT
jgi:photosystem II stability/assembly factor-like uncharacterized protein